jgi:sterol 3beta-glucosyltransferase
MSRRSSEKPPKILIASLGTRGDVQPYVALAAALSRQGAEAVVSTGAGFDAMIEAAGAVSRPAPIDYQDILNNETMRAALFTLGGKIRAARESIELQRGAALALWAIALEEKPDLILFNLKATVMTLAARRLNVPALPTSLQPFSAPTGDFPVPLFGIPDMGKTLNRASYGLLRRLVTAGLGSLHKPLKQLAADVYTQPGALVDGHMPQGWQMPGNGQSGGMAPSLQGFSRALVPTPEDWPAHARPCGYWFGEPEFGYVPPQELSLFLNTGAPPLYIGFGSMPSKNPDRLTDLIFEALKRTGHRAILSKGWGGLTAEKIPDPLAKRVFVLESAPHSWLFPRCTAVVHHGGAGTTHEALRWLRPSLVCPVFADQPYWGARVHAIGAGPEPIRQKDLTADTFAAALSKLDDPGYLNAAAAAAETMRSEPGANGTAKWLIEFIGNDS